LDPWNIREIHPGTYRNAKGYFVINKVVISAIRFIPESLSSSIKLHNCFSLYIARQLLQSSYNVDLNDSVGINDLFEKEKSQRKNSTIGTSIFEVIDGDQSKNLDSLYIGEIDKKIKILLNYLKDPEPFVNVTIPKGFLFYGPPGTGKTYLAKSIAECSGYPALLSSGCNFVDRYVGTGPSNIRELFNKANELKDQHGYAFIVIDEIDAIGIRNKNENREYNNTINEFLTQLDGIHNNENIIVIGTTNYKENIDEAILRPGRISCEIRIDLPDEKLLVKLLNFYSPHDNINFQRIATSMVGFSPAAVKEYINFVNLLLIEEGENPTTQFYLKALENFGND